MIHYAIDQTIRDYCVLAGPIELQFIVLWLDLTSLLYCNTVHGNPEKLQEINPLVKTGKKFQKGRTVNRSFRL